MLLDATVVFVQTPVLEIGQSRNYKAVTAGQAITDVTAFSFQFYAPNFKPTTPVDYGAVYNESLGQVLHTWSPIADPCLVTYGLVYEIYLEEFGIPGTLLWMGVANQWQEFFTVTEPRAYYLRAKNNYANGDYIRASVGGGGDLFDQPLFGESKFN